MRAQIDEVRVWVSQSWAETDWPAAHRAFHWRLFDCTKLILLCIVLPAFTHSFIALRINLTHSSFSSLLTKQNHCHLLGSLSNSPGSWAAVSIWNGTLNGVVSAFNETFYVHFDGPKGKHLLFKGSHLKIDKKCGKTSYFTRTLLSSPFSASLSGRAFLDSVEANRNSSKCLPLISQVYLKWMTHALHHLHLPQFRCFWWAGIYSATNA